MRITSFSDLCGVFEDRQIPFHREDVHSALEIPTRIRGEQFVAVLVWDPRAKLFQVVQPLIFDVPADRHADIAMALVHVNHALVLPGFGLDPHLNRLYYRWVVPRQEDGSMLVRDLDKAVQAVLDTCRDFLPPMRALVAGEITPDQVLQQASELRDQPPAG